MRGKGTTKGAKSTKAGERHEMTRGIQPPCASFIPDPDPEPEPEPDSTEKHYDS